MVGDYTDPAAVAKNVWGPIAVQTGIGGGVRGCVVCDQKLRQVGRLESTWRALGCVHEEAAEIWDGRCQR
jgi:hypothetical protein